ncbi:hypothetical protein [Paraburkholderia sp. SOS3]|uniref:hypothetical protein n=1 Tax=Paraburkholderia sp. SOS3 TaxID=1926494 RepID=UPI0009476329|nr:hypothetical protein [Paraburkholderia sp. SOS3]APR40005.1 hypothetical protein BTO02_33210 [Paraburkholderia sp. SOS3]
MKLKQGDKGTVFVAPSQRRVVFDHEHRGRYVFIYEDDPDDGLALSAEGLKILERAPAPAVGGQS